MTRKNEITILLFNILQDIRRKLDNESSYKVDGKKEIELTKYLKEIVEKEITPYLEEYENR